MAGELPSIANVAQEIANSLARHEEKEALRLAFHFVESFDTARPDERHKMIAKEPSGTGDARFDSLLAAIVEFVSARHSRVAPDWVERPGLFLSTWWFVSGMPTLHANAIAHSPISFARRGVFITEDALTYA
jgi:hypothetical protein